MKLPYGGLDSYVYTKGIYSIIVLDSLRTAYGGKLYCRVRVCSLYESCDCAGNHSYVKFVHRRVAHPGNLLS